MTRTGFVVLVVLHALLLVALALLALPAPAWADCLRDGQQQCLTPDPVLTPGAVDPRVTQDNVQRTICEKGYTKGIRHTSGKVKALIYRRYGVVRRPGQLYEIDHLEDARGEEPQTGAVFTEPHCPHCDKTFQSLGMYTAENKQTAFFFCPACGCTIGAQYLGGGA